MNTSAEYYAQEQEFREQIHELMQTHGRHVASDCYAQTIDGEIYVVPRASLPGRDLMRLWLRRSGVQEEQRYELNISRYLWEQDQDKREQQAREHAEEQARALAALDTPEFLALVEATGDNW